MTTNFIKAVDNIYWPMGGYNTMVTVIPESELADAVTFNGPTWYASSLYTENGPYYLFDLNEVGYTSGQLYRVYNDKFRFQYAARAYKDNSGYIYYGYSDEDKTFIEKTTHGSRYYFCFESATGPQISQFIVDHTADPQITQEYIKDVVRKNSLASTINKLNEAFVFYSGIFNIYTLQSTIDSISNFQDLSTHPNCISILGVSTSTYFQPRHDTWLSATDSDGNPLHISNIIGMDDILGMDNWINKTFLDTDNYQLFHIEARPHYYNSPVSRTINGLGTPLASNLSPPKLNLQIYLSSSP